MIRPFEQTGAAIRREKTGMIISGPEGGKVLIRSSGDITLLAETEIDRHVVWRQIQRHVPAVAISALAVTVVSTLVSLTATAMLLGHSEALLEARIRHLANHLQTVAAAADIQSQRQAFRVMEHVEQVGDKVEKVGDSASALADHVDLLPDTIGKAAQTGTQSVIGWLAALKPAAVTPASEPASPPGASKRKK